MSADPTLETLKFYRDVMKSEKLGWCQIPVRVADDACSALETCRVLIEQQAAKIAELEEDYLRRHNDAVDRYLRIKELERELSSARDSALEEAAKLMEQLAPTITVPEQRCPVHDDYGDYVGDFIDPAGVRKKFVTGERAAAAIRALAKAKETK